MALGADNLIDDNENDHERLVNNHSVNSFMSENHEFTITRSFGDRKYSTMCFKPSNQNMVDIIITQGEYSDGKPNLFLNHIGSQDIRRKYSTKAKFGVALVIMMLLVMLILVIFCLLASPTGHSASNNTGHVITAEHTNVTALNSTQTQSVSEAVEGQIISYGYSGNRTDVKSAVVEIPV